MTYLMIVMVILIPFQGYFNFYADLSISLAQILSIALFGFSLVKIRLKDLYSDKIILSALLYVLIMLFSIGIAENKLSAIKYFLKWSAFVLIAISIYVNVETIKTIRKILYAFLFAAFLVSLMGIYEHYMGIERTIEWIKDNRIFMVLMEPKTLKDILVNSSHNWINWAGPYSSIRAFGTFEDAISFSAYLGLLLPFGQWFGLRRKTCRPVLMIAIMFLMAAMILSFSRSAVLAMLCVIAAECIVLLKKKEYVIGLIIVALLIIISVMVYKPLREPIEWRLEQSIYNQFDKGRFWGDSLKIISKKPVTGVGVANYYDGYKKYVDKEKRPEPAHNQYLQILAEVGIFGLLVYVSIIIWGIFQSFLLIKKARFTEISGLSLGFFGLWIWYSVQSLFNTYLFDDKFSMMFWLMVGLNAALVKLYYRDYTNMSIKASVKVKKQGRVR